MDVCLIPFILSTLIESTHPVKIYEYFAAGKPVVSTDLKELHTMKNLCYIAKDRQSFLEKLDMALKENDEELKQRRIKFASKNTWEHRFETLYHAINNIEPMDLRKQN